MTGLALWPAGSGMAAPLISPETGGEAWEITTEGVTIRLGQISPDQTRAFYLARGFDRQGVERIAAACVFQTVLRNGTSSRVSFNLGEWRARGTGWEVAPKLDGDWQREWQSWGAPKAARAAFRWALFPSVQEYDPGDWNMGMVTYPVAAGTKFNLEIVWRTPDGRKSTTITGLRCANDSQSKP